MSTTHYHAGVPLTAIRIAEAPLRAPRGFRVGDICAQPGGNYRYLIRNRDAATILVRPSPCADEILPAARLATALHAACDATLPRAPAPQLL